MDAADGPGNSAAFSPEADDVFARIARDYDRYCDLFSFYIHRLWKREIARQAATEPGTAFLDLASGTGDIPLRALARLQATGRPVRMDVTDVCQPMLDIAAPKLARFGGATIGILDACDMAGVADDRYDVITMAFGMKIIDRFRAMPEILRCLKPGGVFLCIEASAIPVRFLHRLYLGYMDVCLPLMGRLVARGDSSTYDYLLRGVHGFPDQKAFAAELTAAGFTDVSYRNLTLGVVAIHRAKKPVR